MQDRAFEIVVVIVLALAAAFGLYTNWGSWGEYLTDPQYWKFVAGATVVVVIYAFRNVELMPGETPGFPVRLPKVLFETEAGHKIGYRQNSREFFCDGRRIQTKKPWTPEKVVQSLQYLLKSEAPIKLKSSYYGTFRHERSLHEEPFTGGPEIIRYNSGQLKIIFDPDKLTLEFSIQQPTARPVGPP